MSGYEFRLLGPVETRHDGAPVRIGAQRQRGLLAALLVHADRVVPADRLIGYLWGENPPASAHTTLRSLVSRLRGALPPADGQPVVLSRPPGYLIRAETGVIDLRDFDELAARGRTELEADDPAAASATLRRALALWRGAPLSDIGADALRAKVVPALEECRFQALTDRIEADLRLGDHARQVPDLRRLVAEHPLREGPRGLLMRALRDAGRRAEALEVYRDLWRTLADELGVEPEPGLQTLHRELLRGHRGGRPAHDETRPATAVVAQLPAPISDFVGRPGLLDTLRGLAEGEPDTVRVVVVTGGGGVGKTAPAARWAHELAHRYPTGQFHVDLRGFTPEPELNPAAALGAFLRALGVAVDRIPVDVAEAAAKFRSVLAGPPVLVVLDNAASAEQVLPLLPASPGSLVIVTSRNRLPGLTVRLGRGHRGGGRSDLRRGGRDARTGSRPGTDRHGPGRRPAAGRRVRVPRVGGPDRRRQPGRAARPRGRCVRRRARRRGPAGGPDHR
jgi:DNA-binding SARP family transcriptional activator